MEVDDLIKGRNRKEDCFLVYIDNQKNKNMSFIDSIPERYKRTECIIDKIKIKNR